MNKTTSINVWRVPLILAVITFTCLLTALLGAGIWYVVSWLLLALPLIIILIKTIGKKDTTKSK